MATRNLFHYLFPRDLLNVLPSTPTAAPSQLHLNRSNSTSQPISPQENQETHLGIKAPRVPPLLCSKASSSPAASASASASASPVVPVRKIASMKDGSFQGHP